MCSPSSRRRSPGPARWCRRQPAAPADLVLLNGKIVTLGDAGGGAGARGARWAHRRARIGRRRSSGTSGRATEVIDVGGQLVIPGFIEGHGHFNGVGQAQLQLNLMKAASWDEIVGDGRRGGEAGEAGRSGFTAAAGIRRNGSRRRPRTSKGFPTHDTLSRVSPDNPGAADPRQRSRQLCQREGDAAVGRRRRHAEPAGRRLPQGRDRQADRDVSRDRVAA